MELEITKKYEFSFFIIKSHEEEVKITMPHVLGGKLWFSLNHTRYIRAISKQIPAFNKLHHASSL